MKVPKDVLKTYQKEIIDRALIHFKEYMDIPWTDIVRDGELLDGKSFVVFYFNQKAVFQIAFEDEKFNIIRFYVEGEEEKDE